MNPSNKYYNSGWRRDTAGLPGGFLMDSSVHFIAALRTLARAAGARGAGVRRGAARAGGCAGLGWGCQRARGCCSKPQPQRVKHCVEREDACSAATCSASPHISAAAGWGEAVAASATVSSYSPDLPPPDTAVGMVRFEGGQAATCSISFASALPRFTLTATGRKVRWRPPRRERGL